MKATILGFALILASLMIFVAIVLLPWKEDPHGPKREPVPRHGTTWPALAIAAVVAAVIIIGTVAVVVRQP